MEPLEFDLIYFAFVSMMLAFAWWWCCSDQPTTCFRRPRPVADAATIAAQRELLTLQLQDDLRELREFRLQRQQQNGGSIIEDGSLDPATAEELAKIQVERRKGIKAQLSSREYQTTIKSSDQTTVQSGDASITVTAPAPVPEEDCEFEGACNICLNEFQQGEEVSDSLNPECRHFFHTECVIDWLLRNKICPICRREFLQAQNP